MKRRFSLIDQLCIQAELLLHLSSNTYASGARANPAQTIPDAPMTDTEREHVAGLMRINHSGEVCAQALYLGQALAARDSQTRESLNQAALEEGDHLLWCQDRIRSLSGRTSFLNPLWYVGSLGIGMAAGIAGDAISLGFIVETEKQVERHLEGHLLQIPAHDEQTRAILTQMHQDEIQHGNHAQEAGAVALPSFIQQLMHSTARIMVKCARWV
ncbi:MAG: 2-polyprenyl-3-methyl-6-methoxy-1,4-benzoquinone monooxygenase [Gammaproteobacteria bacterium]